MPVRYVERWESRCDETQFEGAVGGQLYRVVDGVGVRAQQAGHLVAAAQVCSSDAGHPPSIVSMSVRARIAAIAIASR